MVKKQPPKFKRTKEMTKRVQRVVQNVNRKREREISKGNIAALDFPKLYAKDIWEMFNKVDNPASYYNAFIGTDKNPGIYAMMQGRYKGNWEDIVDDYGGHYLKGQEKADKKLRRFKNIERKDKHFQAVEHYSSRIPKPDYIDDDEYNGVIDAIARSRANTSYEDEPPEDFKYDRAKYSEGFKYEASARLKAENYINLLAELQYLPALPEIPEIINYLFRFYPTYAESLFNNPDPEADADWVYQEYMDILNKAKNNYIDYDINGRPKPGNRKTGTYFNADKAFIDLGNRLLRYWRDRKNEADGVA